MNNSSKSPHRLVLLLLSALPLSPQWAQWAQGQPATNAPVSTAASAPAVVAGDTASKIWQTFGLDQVFPTQTLYLKRDAVAGGGR